MIVYEFRLNCHKFYYTVAFIKSVNGTSTVFLSSMPISLKLEHVLPGDMLHTWYGFEMLENTKSNVIILFI